MSKQDNRHISRRDVVRGGIAGAAAVGTSMAAATTDAQARPIPAKWDHDVDVAVIGYGGAGAAAAITAHDNGAKVLILEKMPQGGGNTRVSAGGILCPTNVEDAYTYISALYDYSNSEIDKTIVRLYAEMSVKTVDWVMGLKEGTKLAVYGGAGYPHVPGSKSMQKYAVQGAARGMAGGADNLWAVLTYAVEEKRKIQVMTETPAQRLVTGAEGEVIGVVARAKGQDIAIRARRAVILTTGGYEFDERAKQNFYKGFPIHSLGNPGNTGDGIRMAQQIGASLWHMNGASCPLGIKVPEFEAAFMMHISQPGFIFVDQDGKRFRNEKAIEAHAGLLAVDFYDTEELKYPRIPCYAIFDEETRVKGPISALAGLGYAGKRYKWSQDNAAEIDKGWIIKAATLAELAGRIKVEPKSLEATVAKWNADVKAGDDTLFHRPIKAPAHEGVSYQELARPVWSAPLEKAPYYAMVLYPTLLNTQGGPRRNIKAQILDCFDEPIPRLYSAGELGSMWGVIYQGAGNNAESIVFGQIAGRNAAAEKPLV